MFKHHCQVSLMSSTSHQHSSWFSTIVTTATIHHQYSPSFIPARTRFNQLSGLVTVTAIHQLWKPFNSPNLSFTIFTFWPAIGYRLNLIKPIIMILSNYSAWYYNHFVLSTIDCTQSWLCSSWVLHPPPLAPWRLMKCWSLAPHGSVFDALDPGRPGERMVD